jgi:predicted metal-dependent hydrolase
LGKKIEKEGFEKDLIEAREFAKSLLGIEIENGEYLGKGYSVKCLPEFYNQIIWFLTKKKDYVGCFLDDSDYSVNDEFNKKIIIEKLDEKINRTIF